MFNSQSGRTGEDANTILRKAADRARQQGVGTYTIAVKADGVVKEVNDESELNRVLSANRNVVYHGILIDGKGGIIEG